MTELGERFTDSVALAGNLHRAQLRKTTKTPYLGHLLGVAAIVIEHGGTEDEAIAAVLHDAVEDQGGNATRAQILRQFGPTVTAIVDGCTEDRTDKTLSHRQTKEKHLNSIRTASSSVALVYAADKLHNAGTILIGHRKMGVDVWKHFAGGRDQVIWYYESALQSFHGRVPETLFEQLSESVTAISRLA